MTTIRISEKTSRAAHFARFCIETGTAPFDAAQLVTLAVRAFNAGVRACNVPNTTKALNKAYTAFEECAKAHRFTVSWPGLMPVLHRRGKSYAVPEV